MGHGSDNDEDGERLDPINVEVGARLRTRRLKLQLPEWEFANLIGVSAESLRDYELGVVPVTPSMLIRTAGMTSEPVQNLLDMQAKDMGFEEPPGSNERRIEPFHAAKKQNVIDDDVQDLLLSYSRISDPGVKERVRQLVRNLATP